MSGGSYDYAFQKLEDLAGSIVKRRDNKITRLRVSKLLKELADICHDIEWIDSGDYGDDDWVNVEGKLKNLTEKVSKEIVLEIKKEIAELSKLVKDL